VLVNLWI